MIVAFLGYLRFVSCFMPLYVLKPISSSCFSVLWSSGGPYCMIVAFLGYRFVLSLFYISLCFKIMILI